MKTSIYRDIIDEKIAEWRSNLSRIEEQLAHADHRTKEELGAKVEKIRHQIDRAIVQLLILDKEETMANTVDTKNKIVEVFNSVDRDFPRYEDSAPYML